jgi:hypothetical protein
MIVTIATIATIAKTVMSGTIATNDGETPTESTGTGLRNSTRGVATTTMTIGAEHVSSLTAAPTTTNAEDPPIVTIGTTGRIAESRATLEEVVHTTAVATTTRAGTTNLVAILVRIVAAALGDNKPGTRTVIAMVTGTTTEDVITIGTGTITAGPIRIETTIETNAVATPVGISEAITTNPLSNVLLAATVRVLGAIETARHPPARTPEGKTVAITTLPQNPVSASVRSN